MTAAGTIGQKWPQYPKSHRTIFFKKLMPATWDVLWEINNIFTELKLSLACLHVVQFLGPLETLDKASNSLPHHSVSLLKPRDVKAMCKVNLCSSRWAILLLQLTSTATVLRMADGGISTRPITVYYCLIYYAETTILHSGGRTFLQHLNFV
jgi:hypothetical protein